MFSKKSPKPQSTSKLLHLLTKRSSLKKITPKRGVYDQWPAQQKPSLFNCSTNYLKYLSACNSQHKDSESVNDKKKKTPTLGKQAATFSTCTTMEFFPTTQQNIQSKFTTTPKSQQSHDDILQIKKHKFTPYMTPLEDNQQLFDQSQSHLKHLNDEEYDGQLNSKYDPRPKTVNCNKKGQTKERRMIKTAKIHRQNLQSEEIIQETANTRKLSTGRITPLSNPRELSIKSPNLISQGFIKANGMRSPTMRTNSSKENLSMNYNYPMRLKDYETNFQAYKLISELIDQQMKWEPKRARPKSSVLFRKYNVGAKA